MRIGVFGGTFDPVHLGHLILAEQCREQAQLDEVVFVPAARPPHKLEHELTPFSQRAEMLALAVAGHNAFQIDDLEKDRPGPSYTVDTLEELNRRHRGATLALLLGSDCLPDLVSWRAPARIIELAELVLVERPGWALWPAARLRSSLALDPAVALRHHVVHNPAIEIASRDLRRRVGQGHTIRYLVPRAVEAYVMAHRLYQP
jgi:nicotinate-nucleotide adenylyltransferase